MNIEDAVATQANADGASRNRAATNNAATNHARATGDGAATSDGAAAFARRMDQVEAWVETIEQSSDATARDAARETVRALLDLHGAGLAKILEWLERAGDSGHDVLEACAQDDLIKNLLLLHDLHPQSLETRVGQALDSVRPYLASHGGGVTLVGISAGTVRLQMNGSCDGCPSSAATLKQTIEQAVYQAAPEVSGIEVDGLAQQQPAPSHLVQLESPA